MRAEIRNNTAKNKNIKNFHYLKTPVDQISKLFKLVFKREHTPSPALFLREIFVMYILTVTVPKLRIGTVLRRAPKMDEL